MGKLLRLVGKVSLAVRSIRPRSNGTLPLLAPAAFSLVEVPLQASLVLRCHSVLVRLVIEMKRSLKHVSFEAFSWQNSLTSHPRACRRNHPFSVQGITQQTPLLLGHARESHSSTIATKCIILHQAPSPFLIETGRAFSAQRRKLINAARLRLNARNLLGALAVFTQPCRKMMRHRKHIFMAWL